MFVSRVLQVLGDVLIFTREFEMTDNALSLVRLGAKKNLNGCRTVDDLADDLS